LKDMSASIKEWEWEREIGERKKAEEELQKQQEWLRVILSSIGDALIASDREGRVTFLNPVAVRLTGWQSEEALGQPIKRVFQIINEKTHQPAGDLVGRVLSEKRVVALANDTALVTKDGREIPIEDSAAPILDSAGNIIGVVLVFHDVTERRRKQAALREAHEQAVWLARFPQQNPNPILRASADGTVLYCNPAAAKLHEWKCQVGQVLLQNELLQLVGQAMAEAREIQEDIQLGGKVYIVWVEPVPEERYANTYGRDITKRKQGEEEIKKLNEELSHNVDELEAANKELEAFSYSVSHDLRAPLRAIDGFSRVIPEDYFDKLDDEGKRVIAIIRNNTQKMAQLIDDLLVFSRLGRQEIRISGVDMEKLARDVFKELKPTAAERKIQFDIKDLGVR